MSIDSLTAWARRSYSASIENSVTSGLGRLWVSAVVLRSRRRISGESLLRVERVEVAPVVIPVWIS